MKFFRGASHRLFVLLLALTCFTALAGCGRKAMYHVKGKVTYKDGSVPKGSVAVVIFTPTDNSTAEIRKGASGSIEPDGTFEMVTRMPGDGVNRGEYAVTFRVLRETPTAMVSLVAPKFASPAEPAFTVTVDRNISDLSYEIEKAQGVPAGAAATSDGPGTGPGT